MILNYKTFGQGEPLLILHGLLGTLDNWQTVAKKLAKKYTVYIIDQRNHGRSPHAETFNYGILAEDLKDFMEQHWIYQAHLLGHSMGGKTVMKFALEYPDMVDKLIVVDIAPVLYTERHNHIFKALSELPLDTLQNRKEADAFLEKYISDYGERQFLLKNLTRKKEGGYQFKMNLPVLQQNYQEILAAIESEEHLSKPTLFIRGGLSQHVLEVYFGYIQGLFPQAIIQTIEQAGHWVHADAPDELIQKVEAFLDK